MSAGKGDRPRKVNKKIYDQNFDRIFKKQEKCSLCGIDKKQELKEVLERMYNCPKCSQYQMNDGSFIDSVMNRFIKKFGKKKIITIAEEWVKNNSITES